MSRNASVTLGCLTMAVSGPLLVFNALSGIVGGIWLATLGEWDAVLGGLVLILLSPHLISFVLMLGRTPLLIITDRFPRARGLQNAALILFLIYTISVVTAYSIFVLGNILAHAEEPAHIPALLWAYIVATSPWVFLARKDEEAEGSPSPGGITAIFAQLAFITIGVWLLVSTLTIQHALLIFFGIMVIGQILNVMLFRVFTVRGETQEPSAPHPAAAQAENASAPSSAASPSENSSVILSCPDCAQRLRVPANRGHLRVQCAGCARLIDYNPTA